MQASDVKTRMPSPKQRVKGNGGADPKLVAARGFESSNSTTARFLGGKQKAWMVGDRDLIDRSTTLPQKTSVVIKPSESPEVIQSPSTSFNFEGIDQDEDRGKFPARRRKIRNDKGVSRKSTNRTMSNHPLSQPLNSPTNGSCKFSVPLLSQQKLFDDVLPSPSPSEENRQEGTQALGPDHEDCSNPSARDASATRLQDFVQKYGGLDDIEKALEKAKKSSGTALQLTSPPNTSVNLHTSTPSNPVSDPEGCPSGSPMDNTPRAGSHKRVQEDLTEPRKRHSLPASPMIAPGQPQSTHALVRNGQSSSIPATSPFAIQSLSQRLEVRIQQRANKQMGEYEHLRLGLLRDACLSSDYEYLILHQVYCLNSLSIPISCLTELHEKGLSILANLLAPNNLLANDAVEWFSDFPRPLGPLHSLPPILKEIFNKVLECLTVFAVQWVPFHSLSSSRGYPPLVEEIMTKLKVDSVIVQQVINRSVLRQMWIGPKDHCYSESEAVFPRDQAETMRILSHVRGESVLQVNSDSAALNEEMIVHKKDIIGAYSSIAASHLGHALSLPGFSTTATPNAQMAQARAAEQRSVSQSSDRARRGSFRSVSASQYGRPAPPNIDIQAAQGISRAMSGFPTPITPSVAGPQTAPDANEVLTAWPISQFHSPQAPIPNASFSQQSSHLAQSPTQMQGFCTPQFPANSTNQAYSQQRHFQQSMQGTMESSFPSQPRFPVARQQTRQVRIPTPRIVSSNVPIFSDGNQPQQHESGALQFHLYQLPQTANMQPAPRNFGPNNFPFVGGPRQPPQVVNGRPRLDPAADQFIRLPYFNSDSSLPTHPDPNMTALHQVPLRSPVMHCVDAKGQVNSTAKWYRYIEHVFMPSDLVSRRKKHQSWEFVFNHQRMESLANTFPGPSGALPVRHVLQGSMMCRVRCLKVPSSKHMPSQSEWAVADNVWPRNIAIVLNEKALDMRKQGHYGKDLPIDATPFVNEGVNKLSTAVIGFAEDSQEEYAVGLEIVCVTGEATIKENIQSLASGAARKRIIDGSCNIDPDVQVVHSQIVLDLTDPYTSQMATTPVRGKFCRHNQCFDLDVFLQTRSSKGPGQPCDPDAFRCPICGSDVRPQSLIKDGFYAMVIEQLASGGMGDSKAVILHENGDWEVKEEDKAGESGDGMGRRSASALKREENPPGEVIDLDDD